MPKLSATQAKNVTDGAVVTMTGTTTRRVDNPYPGTRPFQQTDRDRFFGRAADAAALAELWQANSLTVAVGPAASGKTSLLHAGVLPLLTDTRFEVLTPGRVSYGATFPFAAQPEHNPYTLAVLRSWSPGETASRLVGLTVHDFMRQRMERHDTAVLAVIDQTEELLADSGPRRTYQRRFLRELVEALQEEPRLHLLLLVRDEAAALLSDVLGDGARYRFTPLTPGGAFEAVTGPTLGTGRIYDVGAAEELVRDLQTSLIVSAGGGERYVADDHVEPALLQVVCARLWKSLPSSMETITLREVHRYGGANAALAAHCAQVIATIADDHDLSTTRLRSWLLNTFVTELGTRGTAFEGMTATARMPNAAARALEDRHLLSAEWRSGSRWYSLLSDRLIEPLRQAAERRPLPAKSAGYLRAAERALAMGELDLAERSVRATLRVSLDTDLRLRAEANSLLGNLAHEREKPAEAEAHYRIAASLFEAVQDTGAVASELAAVGQTLLAQGRLADAVYELRAAADRMPNDLVIQTQLGLALWQLGHGRAAVAILTAALGVDGGNPNALRTRGEILVDLGDWRDAIFDLNRVTLHDRPSARAALGLAFAELGDYPMARRQVGDALAEAPGNGPVLLYAARATALGGDEIEAEELARRALYAADPALAPQQRDVASQLAARSAENRR